jgi:poly-gamma-glutamate capsule biosynthesis protein CapA/YwtB (metallophosphatase superfamily)
MIGGRALPVIETHGPAYPFENTRSVLSTADIAMANLEAPFTQDGDPFKKTYTFRVPPAFAGGIRDAGFDVMTLANNHILDYGPDGLFSTMKVLDSLGIAHCGAGLTIQQAEQGIILERNDYQIGFAAYSLTYPAEFWATSTRSGTAFPDAHRMEKNIGRLKEMTDLVVVSFHWGGEKRNYPKSYQIMYGHLAVDSGADLVIGHHPHVLQGLEVYKDRLIAYSLGNFAFGSYSRSARESMMLKVWLDHRGLLIAQVIPISVYNYDIEFQPKILNGPSRERVIETLNQLSLGLNGGKDIIRKSGLIVVK